ncbi:MAG: hypothetical protein RUMPE_00122 [Eubacteriales bacterium SKADARSKE-1]|nr:hypothetical protein [Eubacteriales bacterium SKADARSKE-1]
MEEKYIPQRMCAGCRERKPKNALLRLTKVFIKNPETGQINKTVVFDKSGKLPGRGVYICQDLNCLKKIKKIRKLERTFSCQVEDSFYKELEEAMSSSE